MLQGDAQPEEEYVSGDEGKEGCSDKLDFEEHVEDEIEEDLEELPEESKPLEEERT